VEKHIILESTQKCTNGLFYYIYYCNMWWRKIYNDACRL